MEIYSTEEQQVDAIKQFYKDYGLSIGIGVVVGLGGLYGWNYYSDMKIEKAEEASQAFQTLTTKSSDEAAMIAGVAEFSKNYDQKGYQSLLDLIVAKTAVEAKDFPKAEEALKKVIAAKPGAGLHCAAGAGGGAQRGRGRRLAGAPGRRGLHRHLALGQERTLPARHADRGPARQMISSG